MEDDIKNDGWIGPGIDVVSGLFTSIFPIAALLYSLLHTIT